MKKMGIDPKEISIVFLSHVHSDHTGGLFEFLNINPNVKVYVPKSFLEKFKESIIEYGAEVIEIEKATKIGDNIYSTGELGTWIKEQSLVIESEGGIVIITGCAHPGITRIVENVKKNFGDRILLVIGGFHLVGKDAGDVMNVIINLKKIGVQYIAPCHCSGDAAKELFKKEFGDHFIEVGVGRTIEIEKLK